MKKIHSRNSGRESEASILRNDREREGNEKLQLLKPVENVVEFSENKVMIREECK